MKLDLLIGGSLIVFVVFAFSVAMLLGIVMGKAEDHRLWAERCLEKGGWPFIGKHEGVCLNKEAIMMNIIP